MDCKKVKILSIAIDKNSVDRKDSMFHSIMKFPSIAKIRLNVKIPSVVGIMKK